MLDEARWRIDSWKEAIEKKRQEIIELEKELSVYYQSIEVLKSEIKQEVTERNNISWL